jgi:Glycerate kinase family
LPEGCPIVIPRTLLIASGAFDRLSARRVVSAISRGLTAAGWPTDPCPLEGEGELAEDVRALLDALDFDTRMRSARAVILGEERLRERTLAGSLTFEIASRARQAGVPAYAVTAQDSLDSFDARILDLQVILEASGPRALERAGRRLAELL